MRITIEIEEKPTGTEVTTAVAPQAQGTTTTAGAIDAGPAPTFDDDPGAPTQGTTSSSAEGSTSGPMAGDGLSAGAAPPN
jgi:hypothetical protein